MKTPQEEAEEMKVKASSFYHTLGMTVRDSIKESIPLSELIAVARAANGLSMGSDWNHGTHAKEHGYRQQLIDALQALRATEKVIL